MARSNRDHTSLKANSNSIRQLARPVMLRRNMGAHCYLLYFFDVLGYCTVDVTGSAH